MFNFRFTKACLVACEQYCHHTFTECNHLTGSLSKQERAHARTHTHHCLKEVIQQLDDMTGCTILSGDGRHSRHLALIELWWQSSEPVSVTHPTSMKTLVLDKDGKLCSATPNDQAIFQVIHSENPTGRLLKGELCRLQIAIILFKYL